MVDFVFFWFSDVFCFGFEKDALVYLFEVFSMELLLLSGSTRYKS